MTIRDRTLRWLASHLKQFLPGPGGVGYVEGGWGTSDKSYDYPTLNAAFGVNPWIYSCVNVTADTLADVPLKVYRETGKGDNVQRVEVFDHDLNDLLWMPNSQGGANDLIRDSAAHRRLAGESFWFIENGSTGKSLVGKPQSLTTLPPRFLKKVETTSQGRISGYTFMQNGQERMYDPEYIVHSKTFNPEDDTRGFPPIQVARNPILLKHYMNRYNTLFFQNFGKVGGALVAKGPLSREAKKINLEAWQKAHQGVEKAWATAHLDSDTSFQDLSTSAKDGEFLGLDNLTREEVLAILMTPPVMVGVFQYANYANSDAQRRIFYQVVIMPLAKAIANAINTQIIGVWYRNDPGLYVQFDFSKIEVLQEDKERQARTSQIYVNSGIMTVNEVRRELDMEPLDGGDVPKSPMGFGLLNADGSRYTKATLAPTRGDQWKAFDREAMIGEQAVAVVMRDFFLDQGQRIVEALSATVVDELSAGRRLVNHTKALSPEQLYAIFDLDAEDLALREAVLPVLGKIIAQAGSGALTAIGSGIDFNMADPRVEAFLASKVMHLAGHVTNTTKEKLRSLLIDSVADDMTVGQTATAIRDTFQDFSSTRALTIARTEVVGANNGAAVEGYRQSGVVKKKEWLTAGGNVRDSHVPMEGQVVATDQPFISGYGNALHFPGDGNAPPEDVVNCRCAVLPVLED